METQEKVGWLLFFLIFVVPAIRACIKNWRKTYKDYEALRLEHKKRMDDYAAELSVLESRNRELNAENQTLRTISTRDATGGLTLTGRAASQALEANARALASSHVSRRADRDYALYQQLRDEWGDSLENIIRQSAHIVQNSPEVASLKVMCSTDLPLLSEAALANYLDSLEVNIAFVQGKTLERPLEIVVRHEDGDWKLLNDGFHHMIFVNGKLSGVPDPGVQGVGRPDQPIHRPRPRFGAHVSRQVGE